MPKQYTFWFFIASKTILIKNICYGVLKFKTVDWLNKIHYLRWPGNFSAFFLENDMFLGHNFSDLLSSKGSWEPKNDRIKKIKSVLTSSEHVFFKNQSLMVIQVSWYKDFCPPSGPLCICVKWYIVIQVKIRLSLFI